jgi:hypothetical protein
VMYDECLETQGQSERSVWGEPLVVSGILGWAVVHVTIWHGNLFYCLVHIGADRATQPSFAKHVEIESTGHLC